LEIHGIHMNDDESIAEVESKVLTVLKKIMETHHLKTLMSFYRLGKLKKNKIPNINVRFISRKPETILVKKGKN